MKLLIFNSLELYTMFQMANNVNFPPAKAYASQQRPYHSLTTAYSRNRIILRSQPAVLGAQAPGTKRARPTQWDMAQGRCQTFVVSDTVEFTRGARNSDQSKYRTIFFIATSREALGPVNPVSVCVKGCSGSSLMWIFAMDGAHICCCS